MRSKAINENIVREMKDKRNMANELETLKKAHIEQITDELQLVPGADYKFFNQILTLVCTHLKSKDVT